MAAVAGGRPRVLVIGSLNADLVLRTPRLPLPGESLIGTERLSMPGGKGANQAVAAARLGGRSALVGRVGDDSDGRWLREKLREEGVDDRLIAVDAERATGLGVIILEGSGQNRILVYPGANMGMTAGDLGPAFAPDAGEPPDIVVLQLEVPGGIVVEACRLAAARGLPIVLDAGPAQPFPLEELSGLTILTPNETETLALTGVDPGRPGGAEEAAMILQRRSGAHEVVIKLGERGALLHSQGRSESFPANRVEVIDPTAAGDAFTAELALQYAAHGDIRRAVHYANIAGAITVTRLGAQPSLPSAAEVEEFAEMRGLKW